MNGALEELGATSNHMDDILGTTGLVADRLQRSAILIELNPAYSAMGRRRIEDDAGLFAQVEAAE